MNRLHRLSLASKLALYAASIVLIVTGVLAFVVHRQVTDFALANAEADVKRQIESVRSLLDLAYDSERSRAERSLRLMARHY